jgi:hypothetical protein
MTLIIKYITNSSLQFSLQKWQLRFLASQGSFIDLTKSLFSFASSFAEIQTFQKPVNAVIQYINHICRAFSLANPFAENQTFANKCKPVYQLVKTENTLFLCNASLQKP